MNTTTTTNTTTPTATTRNTLVKTQLAALLIAVMGGGWNAGNFAQPSDPLWLDALTNFLHALPIILLVVFGLSYFGAALSARQRGAEALVGPRWAAIGVSVIAVIAIIACVVLTILGVTNPDPNSVGVHNLDDAIPAVLQVVGGLLWLATTYRLRRLPAPTTMATQPVAVGAR